jgi:hypothetical protein
MPFAFLEDVKDRYHLCTCLSDHLRGSLDAAECSEYIGVLLHGR